jgi:prophage DNA circulation protein
MTDPYSGPENGRRIADIESAVAKTQSEVHGLWRAVETISGEVKKIGDILSSRSTFNWEQMGVVVAIIAGGALLLQTQVGNVQERVQENRSDLATHAHSLGHPALSTRVMALEKKADNLDVTLQREMRLLDEILQREMKLRDEATQIQVRGVEKRIDLIDEMQRNKHERLEHDWTARLYRGGKRD